MVLDLSLGVGNPEYTCMQARHLALINAGLTILAKLQTENEQVQAQLVDYSFGRHTGYRQMTGFFPELRSDLTVSSRAVRLTALSPGVGLVDQAMAVALDDLQHRHGQEYPDDDAYGVLALAVASNPVSHPMSYMQAVRQSSLLLLMAGFDAHLVNVARNILLARKSCPSAFAARFLILD